MDSNIESRIKEDFQLQNDPSKLSARFLHSKMSADKSGLRVLVDVATEADKDKIISDELNIEFVSLADVLEVSMWGPFGSLTANHTYVSRAAFFTEDDFVFATDKQIRLAILFSVNGVVRGVKSIPLTKDMSKQLVKVCSHHLGDFDWETNSPRGHLMRFSDLEIAAGRIDDRNMQILRK